MATLNNITLLLLLLSCVCSLAVARKEPQFEEQCFANLRPQMKPRVIFQNDAGMLEVWGGRGFEAMQDARVVAGRLTVKPGGVFMPAFVNIPALKLVAQGSLTGGIIDEASMGNVYELKTGDVVALPSGVPSWWYNSGDQDAIVLCFGDTSSSPDPGFMLPFALAGGKSSKNDGASIGGAIQAFSIKFLAQAWNLSVAEAKTIVTSQQQAGLFKLSKQINLVATNADTMANSTQFVYQYSEAAPDLSVEGAGEVRELNSAKLPVLQMLKMGAECVQLSPRAMVAPYFMKNAHQIIYAWDGSGRMQIAGSSGERALDLELQPGTLAVIPKLFPATIVAGDKGLKLESIVTSDRPLISFLGGKGSVYSGIPSQMLSAFFNIEDQLAVKLQQSSSSNMALIPGKKLPTKP